MKPGSPSAPFACRLRDADKHVGLAAAGQILTWRLRCSAHDAEVLRAARRRGDSGGTVGSGRCPPLLGQEVLLRFAGGTGTPPLTRVVVANMYLSLSWKLSTCSRITRRLRLLWKKSVLLRTVETPCGSLLWTSTVVGGS